MNYSVLFKKKINRLGRGETLRYPFLAHPWESLAQDNPEGSTCEDEGNGKDHQVPVI